MRALRVPATERCTRWRGCGPIDGSISLTAAESAAAAAAAAALGNKEPPPRPAATNSPHRTHTRPRGGFGHRLALPEPEGNDEHHACHPTTRDMGTP
ncbi:unnamed protein product [Gadus morhua 'NCC']